MSYFGTTEFMLRVAAGLVPGYSSVNKFGHNPASAIAGADIWPPGGTYAFYPTTAQSMEIVSDSANDTSAGTGARTATVYGLDASWAEQSETVTMNGTTPVALANTYIRTFRTTIDTAGSIETNDGAVTVQVSGGGTIGVHIASGDGQTQQCIYTIPAGKTAFFIKGYTAIADDDKNGEVAEFKWKMRPNVIADGAWQTKGQMGLNSIGSSNWQYDYGVPAGAIPEKTDIKIEAFSATAIVGVVAGFDLILIENTLLP
jgi:hypothetical protein